MTKETWSKLTEYGKATLVRQNPGVQAQVARKLGVSQGLVSRVMRGKSTSERVLTEILKVVKS